MSIEQSTIWGCDVGAALVASQTSPKTSSLDILDVVDGSSRVYRGLDDDGVAELLQSSDNRSGKITFRIIFIDQVPCNSTRLKITSKLLQRLCEAYKVSRRWLGSVARQHPPGRSVQYDTSGQATQHEFWYSVVLRSLTTEDFDRNDDPTKRILPWTRMCVWSGYDLINGTACVFVMRLSEDMKQQIFSHFEGHQSTLLTRHPMLIHMIIIEDLTNQAYEFRKNFAEAIYATENQCYNSSDIRAYTDRSQVFLQLTRQITQAVSDHPHVDNVLKYLRKEQVWIRENWPSPSGDKDAWLWIQNHEFAEDMLDYLWEEAQLARSYSKLYEKRTEIGIHEGFNRVNQADAELNLQIAAASTQIARGTREDGQSLRALQILGTLFLPISLCSSVFGMGFFTTEPDDSGRPRFLASQKWWIFLALSAVLTTLTVALLKVTDIWAAQQANVTAAAAAARLESIYDEEKTISPSETERLRKFS